MLVYRVWSHVLDLEDRISICGMIHDALLKEARAGYGRIILPILVVPKPLICAFEVQVDPV